MDHNNMLKTYIYLIFLLLLILSSYYFMESKGFIYDTDNMGNLLYTNDLFSSGSDDNLCIAIGTILFCIPLIYKLIRFKKKINIGDAIVFLVIWVVQLIFLFTIEAGSILDTIYIGYNIPLMSWIVFYIASLLICLNVLYSYIKSRDVGMRDRNNRVNN